MTTTQRAAVQIAADLIRADKPGNVVPPRDAVRVLLAAGVDWRCRANADRTASIKGSYQYRITGTRGPWRVLADTPQAAAGAA